MRKDQALDPNRRKTKKEPAGQRVCSQFCLYEPTSSLLVISAMHAVLRPAQSRGKGTSFPLMCKPSAMQCSVEVEAMTNLEMAPRPACFHSCGRGLDAKSVVGVLEWCPNRHDGGLFAQSAGTLANL